jgi:hypothetical protein
LNWGNVYLQCQAKDQEHQAQGNMFTLFQWDLVNIVEGTVVETLVFSGVEQQQIHKCII